MVESVESTNNTPAALEQGVARASSSMHRVMEERVEQERRWREMNRGEWEIRTYRARERVQRETREVVEANEWPQQQGASTSLHEIVCSSHFSTFGTVNSFEDRTLLFSPLISQTACCQDTNNAKDTT